MPRWKRDDVLMDAAKRYRVDTEKLQKAVAEELAAKREKRTKAGAEPKNRKTAWANTLRFPAECLFAFRPFFMEFEPGAAVSTVQPRPLKLPLATICSI